MLSVVMLSDVTLNVTHTPFQLSVTLNDVMLSVVVLSVFILSVFILSVVRFSIVMLSVVMLSVAAPLKVVRNKISTFFLSPDPNRRQSLDHFIKLFVTIS